MEILKGDAVQVVSNRVGQAPRRGTVVRVVRQSPLKIEVQWDDGHTTQLGTAGGNLRVIDQARTGRS